MSLELQPLYDRILVAVDPRPEQTDTGLYLPQNEDPNAPRRGEVLATGEGHLLQDGTMRALKVEPGNRVVFLGRSGVEIEEGDQTYMLLRENELLGILPGSG